ncbi:BRCT domain-containing protein [Anatilimnocola sp. NA78]|uniref:BRCT domain-containing protein n=1 Tax=Anatilimnocola sp. NA78 TaxID=3415683 RepID=UPI003CE51196
MLSKRNDDNNQYFHFTGPARLNKSVHELHGILLGITADLKVSDDELQRLVYWLDDNSEFENKEPFKQVIDMLRTVIEDGIIDESELADLFWMCGKFTAENGYYDAVTADMQRLQGLMGGIAADGIITAEELRALDGWMSKRESLKGCWPFDELESLITHVLKDGIVTASEQTQVMRFFSEFTSTSGHRAVQVTDDLMDFAIAGMCALAPSIEFPERTFCFTGKSERAPRSKIQKLITERGGIFAKNVTQQLHYLVVGCEGNPCWAFSCYGRKVEEAMTLRKNGHKITIVHEVDFWDHVHE